MRVHFPLRILYVKKSNSKIQSRSNRVRAQPNKKLMAHQEHHGLAIVSLPFYSTIILHRSRPEIYAASISSSTLHSPR
uniref:Uncharacterized protein n=1 Tax=Arundo donax TaxID=35708 RepID=A0A0A9CJJ1_ARUDO